MPTYQNNQIYKVEYQYVNNSGIQIRGVLDPGGTLITNEAIVNPGGMGLTKTSDSPATVPLPSGGGSGSGTDENGNLVLESDGIIYYGDEDTDGSWRTYRSGNDLVRERREGGVWVEKAADVA